ncbi:hypothetical protein [Paenibacillus sp. IHBB 10380]|uniref:hypothetical protein n=1 Tax=Paenibacillus sp. IHBB 10380 TaxID=1566358 RepID=UPI0005CFA3C2|nr:hypothetical protein [Paenibacillus sp. IHBB 10380]AJS58407.1 hypothetical protein UB51_07730 [Paenibacillus sp. IHBB 10380]
MTVLGDWNQSIFIHDKASASIGTLNSLYGDKVTETFILTRSYRSARQIVEFTHALIEGGETIEPFNREGKKATLKQLADTTELVCKVAESVQDFQVEGYRTIAVICKTANESKEAYEALKDMIKVRLIGKETDSFQAGILLSSQRNRI